MSTTTKKAELADVISTYAGVSKEKANATLLALFDRIAGNLMTGNQVRLGHVGTLSLSELPKRLGRNPRTGQEIVVEASHKGRFKLSKGYRSSLIPPSRNAA